MTGPHSQDARASAAETANDLLADSAEWVDALLKHDERMGTTSKHAALVTAHAMLSLLDFEVGRIARALEEIAGSVKHLAACPDDANEVPTNHEGHLMFNALMADWMERHPERTAANMGEAMDRFSRIAGLE